MTNVEILTPNGVGKVEKIYVSELGFLMLKINNLNGTYTTYNFGKHDVDVNIFTNQIMENEKSEIF